jgi:hypothetical protein
MRQPQVCKHQVCDHCGGRFGMVTHRWWGNKFCKRTCKDAYLHEVSLDRNIIRRWVSLPSRRILSNSSPRLTAFSDATLIQSYQNFATRFEPLVRFTSPLTGLRIAARPVNHSNSSKVISKRGCRKGDATFFADLDPPQTFALIRFDGRATAVCTSELGRMFCSDEGACVR